MSSWLRFAVFGRRTAQRFGSGCSCCQESSANARRQGLWASASVVGAGNAGVFAEFITHGYFSYVALNFADTAALDRRPADQLHSDPHYHTIAVVPYGTEVPPIGRGTYGIWRYEPKP